MSPNVKVSRSRIRKNPESSPDPLKSHDFNDVHTPKAIPRHDKHDKPKKAENKLPDLLPTLLNCKKYLRKQRSKFMTNIACVRDFRRKNGIREDKAENLVRQAYRYRHLWE